jgi:tRNA(Ile)-lysidine synthase
MQKGSLAAEVALTIEKWGMLSQGESVLVGVSGGADSVCLVRILCELGHRPGLAHVNHGWRGLESDGDARFVESLAASLRLPFFERRAGEAPTGNPPLAPGSNEAEAREIRQRFFDAVMEAEDYQTLALAHSRDDRSETFLFHLLRGSGTQGLVSMRPVAGRTIRPLIATPRAEIETYLKQIGQPWRLDETNKDTRFSRNRIRHAVLPRLAEEFNPRLAESLARTIEILEAEDDWMERAAENWLKPRISEEGSALVVDLDDLPGQEVAFTRRVLRTALRWAGSSLTDMGFDHVENVRSLLEAGKSGKTIELPGDLAVERNFHTLVIRPARELRVRFADSGPGACSGNRHGFSGSFGAA